jgi:hypothetical protein
MMITTLDPISLNGSYDDIAESPITGSINLA